jgi:cell division septation protein DedD
MKRTPYYLALSLLFSGLLFWGCSSSEETESKEEKQPPREFKQVEPQKETLPKTDAPDMEKPEMPSTEKNVPADQQNKPDAGQQQRESTPVEKEQPQQQQPHAGSGAMMWSVQIGAFKAESGAFQLVNDAKNKFKQPVYKQYDPISGFYKVTVGSFQMKDQASQFKVEVQAKGYQDAFLVEVRR